MKDIIKLELFKLKRSKLYWVFFALSFAIPVFYMLLILIVITALGLTIGNLSELLKLSSPITVLFLKSLVSVSSTTNIFAIITAGVVLSKDFNDGTMRNIILANKSRSAMYFSYWLVALLVGVSFLLSNFAAIMLFGAPIFGFRFMSAKLACATVFSCLGLGLLCVIFVQTSVTMFLFGIRKQWAAIVFPLLVVLLLPQIITYAVYALMTTVMLSSNTFPVHLFIWTPFLNLTLFDPSGMTAQITDLLFQKNYDAEILSSILVYFVVSISVFIISGYFSFKKADLK